MRYHGPIQSYTEYCLTCGFNTYDQDCPTECPGSRAEENVFWKQYDAKLKQREIDKKLKASGDSAADEHY